MSFQACIVNDILFVRWFETELGDHARILEQVRAHHAVHGKLVASVTILCTDMKVPTTPFTDSSVKTLRAMAPLIDTFFLVVEAEGLRYTVLRTVGVMVTFLAGIRDRAFVVRSVDDLLQQLADKTPHKPQATLTALRELGLLAS